MGRKATTDIDARMCGLMIWYQENNHGVPPPFSYLTTAMGLKPTSKRQIGIRMARLAKLGFVVKSSGRWVAVRQGEQE